MRSPGQVPINDCSTFLLCYTIKISLHRKYSRLVILIFNQALRLLYLPCYYVKTKLENLGVPLRMLRSNNNRMTFVSVKQYLRLISMSYYQLRTYFAPLHRAQLTLTRESVNTPLFICLKNVVCKCFAKNWHLMFGQRLYMEVFTTSKPGVQLPTTTRIARAGQGMCASLTDAAGRSGRTGVGARYKPASLTPLNYPVNA